LTQCQRTWWRDGERFEFAPQVGILHRLAVGGLPAVALPAVDPGLDPVLHVLRIGVEIDLARGLQRFQRADHRGQFHAVVRRRGFAAAQLLLAVARDEERAPAARTGVPLARAIGVDDDAARRRHGT